MEVWLTHASFGLVLLALLIAGLGVPIPEEPLLLAAGVLAHTDRLPLPLVILACSAAILLSDFSLFSIARHHGPRLQAGEIALQRGTDISVHDRGADPLVLLDLWEDLAGQ